MPLEETDYDIKESILKILASDTAIIAIISPYQPLEIIPRITPEMRSLAKVDLLDVISCIKKKEINKLFVLVDSFMGAVTSFQGLMREIRSNFDYTVIFVPHTTTEGGNLTITVKNKVLMGEAEEIACRLNIGQNAEFLTPFEETRDILNENLLKSIEDKELWKIMKGWIRRYIKNEEGYTIRFVLPDK